MRKFYLRLILVNNGRGDDEGMRFRISKEMF